MLLATAPLALALAGCHHEPGLSGDWKVYSALSSSQAGRMSFNNGKFQEDLVGSGNLGGSLSGTYQVDGVHLHLTAAGVAPTPKPGEKFSLLSATDFRVEFVNSNLGYLIYDSGNAHFELALVRGNEKPDLDRVKLVMRDYKPAVSAIPGDAPTRHSSMNASMPTAPGAATISGTNVPLVTPAYTPAPSDNSGPAFTTAVKSDDAPQSSAPVPQQPIQDQQEQPRASTGAPAQPQTSSAPQRPTPTTDSSSDDGNEQPAHQPNYPGEPPPPPPLPGDSGQ